MSSHSSFVSLLAKCISLFFLVAYCVAASSQGNNEALHSYVEETGRMSKQALYNIDGKRWKKWAKDQARKSGVRRLSDLALQVLPDTQEDQEGESSSSSYESRVVGEEDVERGRYTRFSFVPTPSRKSLSLKSPDGPPSSSAVAIAAAVAAARDGRLSSPFRKPREPKSSSKSQHHA